MDSSDSLQLDEHLARLLAAFDQGMDGGDGKAPTIDIPRADSPLPPPRRAEEVVKPLSGAAANEGSFGELLPDSRTRSSRTPRTSSTTPPPPGGPHRIGRFELRRQLGRGGCGIVFLAFDPKLQREVALKIPRPEMLLSQDARRRLIREALAAAEFDHPNLVPVYETGEIGPICFIATAFCPGLTLGEWLDKQAFPVPVRQAARLIAIVAEAVQHAHDRGVLHRDLKPNNVILQATREDPQEQEAPPGSVQLRGEHYIPRVVDFGLAKMLERGGPSDTTTRQILGTPKYMAPEQAQARHDDVGPTADVYALGVILYEMLAGCAPYEGATDVEVLRQSIDGHLTNPRHIRSDIPRDLEAICLKAMERTPARRYRTAIDLADDLRRFLDGKPTLARPLKWAGRTVKWLRRNDQVVALAVVTVIAAVLLAVGGWYVRQTQQLKSDQDRVAREQAVRMQNDQRREYAEAVRDAYLAWRGGNTKAAQDSRDVAGRLASIGGDPHDFPLRYLTALLAADRLHLACPAGAVTALAVSPDGNRLASGHSDGTIAIWDRASGQQLASLQSSRARITHLRFATGGSRLLSVSVPNQSAENAYCWDVAVSGGQVPAAAVGRAIARGAVAIDVSSNGDTVYVATQDGWLEAINLQVSDKNRRVHVGDPASALSVSAGAEVLVGTRGGKVIRYSPDLVELGASTIGRGPITAVTPDYPAGGFAAASGDGSMSLLPPIGPVFSFLPADRPRWLAGLPGGGLAANDGSGRILILANGRHSLATRDLGSVLSASVSRDGNTLFTGSEDGIICSWKLPEDLVTTGVRSGLSVVGLAIHPNGDRVSVSTPSAFLDRFGTVGETAARTGRRGFAAVRIPMEGPAIAVEFDSGAVVVRDPAAKARTERHRFILPGDANPVSAWLSSDASRLAIGDDRGRAFVWNLSTRSRTEIDCGHRGRVERVVLSDDGLTLAATAGNGILVCTVEDPNARFTLAGDNQAVFLFLSGSSKLVSADRGGAVRVWRLSDAVEESTWHGHIGRVTALGVSPDSRTVVSGGATGEVKFWDARTGVEIFGLRRQTGAVTAIEFAQNGKLLVTAGPDHVAIWEAAD